MPYNSSLHPPKPTRRRSMSSRSDRGSPGEGLDVDSDNMPPLVRRINSASLTVKTMSKPISLVKRIQNDVAESAFQEIQEQMSIPLEKRMEALGEMDIGERGVVERGVAE